MSIASNSACGGAPMPSSIFTNPMKRGMLISPSGWWELLSRTYVEPPRGSSTSTSEVFQSPVRAGPHQVRNLVVATDRHQVDTVDGLGLPQRLDQVQCMVDPSIRV